MRNLARPATMLAASVLLAFFSAALARSISSYSPSLNADKSAALALQSATPTPQPEDNSEIGSTDGIVAMGFAVALIVIVPILLQRKQWTHT
jgi:hypothetical protein